MKLSSPEFEIAMKPWLVAITFVALLFGPCVNLFGQDEFALSASWGIPDQAEIVKSFEDWLGESNVDEGLRQEVLNRLAEDVPDPEMSDRLDFVLSAMQKVHPEIATHMKAARTPRSRLKTLDFNTTLSDSNISPFVKVHLRLLKARWMTQNQLLDEALQELESIEIGEVLAPETLLFYRAIAQHQLLKKEDCVSTIDALLENESQIPKRFATLSRLMAADIKPMEPDSLDEISRMMKDIKRRQSLYRSGKRVRNQEEEVIGKLDKIIEKIEQQRQQQQQQQSGNSNSSTPMEDSQNASGQGTGEVRGKQQVEGGDWGALPPAERAAAMAEMAKDLPPHYRSVIEEYFRKLADDAEQDKRNQD